jgi:hypothetical protein
VEVFVTVESVPAKGAPGWTPASDINLNFDDPEADGPGRSTTTVPSGHSREVNFAVVQVLTDEHGHLTDQWGYLAVYPPRFAKNPPPRAGRRPVVRGKRANVVAPSQGPTLVRAWPELAGRADQAGSAGFVFSVTSGSPKVC